MAKVKDLLVNGSSRFIGKIYASDQFISQVANGTAPFVVSSSTLVANLNADMTDGLHVHTGRNNEVNKIVRTDANGYIQTGYINTNVGTENLAISRIFYEYNNDGYIRKISPSSFFSVLENSGNDISITVAGQNRKLTVGYASNADKLDGVHYQNILERQYSGSGSSGTATGWFRIAETLTTDGDGITFLLAIQRSYWYANNESYLFSITIAYNGGISITQLSGYANNRLITKIRVDWANSRNAYVDLYINSSSTNNRYYWYTVGCAKSYTAWTANPTLVGNAYEFTTVQGCKSDRGFTGDIVGNASSATKWETARTITLTGSVTGSVSIDGSQNVSLATTTNHTHNYLPLSGGTLSGYLTIKNPSSDVPSPLIIDTNSTVEVGQYFRMSGTNKGWIGYHPNSGMYLYTYNGPHMLGIKDDGTGYIDSNTILHSGNYNSYAPKLDGTGASGTWGINISGKANIANNLLFIENIPANTRGELSRDYRLYTGIWSKKDLGYASQYGQFIDLSGGTTWYHRLAFNTTGVIEHFQGINTTTLTKVGDLAYTSSNVASSSKWATPRTITLTGSVTGSVSIDGSQNVSLATTTNHTHNYAGSSSAGGSANSALTLLYNNKFDTTYGSYAIFQQSSNISGFPHTGWFNSIKMLHNNSSGYFTEIAMSFTGEDGMWRRALRNSKQVGWYKMLDSGNYNSYALPISGGTLTGSVTMRGMDTNLVRDIVYDGTGGWARGLITLRVDGVDKFNIGAYGGYTVGASNNGIYYGYIGCNSYDGLNLRISATSLSWGDNSILHTGNYNSYCPKLDGTGASGTWGISISGNAATATNADTLDGYHETGFYRAAKQEIPSGDLALLEAGSYYAGSTAGDTNPLPSTYASLSVLGKSYYATQLCVDYNGSAAWLRGIINSSSGVTAYGWHQLAFTDSNVASATKLLNSRTIWGQSFDGTGNVSGALTGVTTITTSGQICINTSSSQRNNYNEGIRCNLGGSDNWASVVLGGASGSTNGAGSGVYSLLVNSSLFRIRQNNTEVLCINTSNNVGIGTTSPSYKLHIVGDIYTTTGFKKEGSSDSYVLLGGGGHKALSDFDIPASTTSSGITSLATGSYSSIHISTRSGGTMSFSSTPASGKECHIVIYNSGSSNITITLPSGYRRNIDSITIASGAFGEVNVLNAAGTIYVRAV